MSTDQTVRAFVQSKNIADQVSAIEHRLQELKIVSDLRLEYNYSSKPTLTLFAHSRIDEVRCVANPFRKTFASHEVDFAVLEA